MVAVNASRIFFEQFWDSIVISGDAVAELTWL